MAAAPGDLELRSMTRRPRPIAARHGSSFVVEPAAPTNGKTPPYGTDIGRKRVCVANAAFRKQKLGRFRS